MKNKMSDVDITSETYEKMLRSSIALKNQIRNKYKLVLEVTQEEADFVNDFEDYLKEVLDAVESKENLN